MCEDARYITALLSAMIIRLVMVLFSVYLLLWVTSFVDTGVLESEKAAATLYSKIALLSVLFMVVCLPLAGILADKVSPRIIIPIAFLIRAVCIFGFLQLDRPDTFMAYFFIISMVLSSLFEGVSIEVLFFKKMPSDIRGVLMGLFSLFAMLGTLVFTLISGIIYEEHGPDSPFIICGICDVFIALFVISLSCFGKLRD